MVKTYIQPGHTITVAAPTGGVLSDQGVLIGTLFGIAQYDAVEGADVEILTEGVIEIGKTSALSRSTSATDCSGTPPTRW